MKKINNLKDYNDEYGHIQKDFINRVFDLFSLKKIKEKDFNKLKYEIRRIRGIQKHEISFVFYFTPQATPRPRYSKFTKSFYIKNKLQYNDLFGQFIREVNINTKITTPCEFYCKTYSPIPSGMNKIETFLAELSLIKNISKPDWDNLAKTYCDMVQKHLILDDSLIYKGSLEKLYSTKPRIEMIIKYYDDYDCNYNAKKIMNNSIFKN